MSERIKMIIKKHTPSIFLNIVRLGRSIVFLWKNYNAIAAPAPHADNYDRWLYLLFKGKINLILSCYFKTEFDWARVDKGVLDALSNAFCGGEGCLLEHMGNDLRVRTQVNFLVAILKQTKAKKILEIGTHKAMFCYLVHVCDSSATVDTFGNLPESKKAVDILNSKYGVYIHYHLGDSRQTLRDFHPHYRIDIAWVDGGHSYEVCMSDLVNCARLGTPSIVVDDYKWSKDVKAAVDEFLIQYHYSIDSISNIVDYRGIVYLSKD